MNRLNELSKSIHSANKEKGFWDGDRNVGELLMLVVSELGEALEAKRKDRHAKSESHVLNLVSGDVDFKTSFEQNIKDTFEDEIADSIIRLLDMCGGLGINIEFFISEKLRYNKTRPRLHGKKF